MSNDQKYVNQIPVTPPDDVNKPFFAYGIFKKGQIAHSKIEDCVEFVDDADDVEITDCELKVRDGVPFIADKTSEGYNTKGQIIHFCEGREEEAYQIISDTEPEDLYEWGETTVKGKEVNVLYGIAAGPGSFLYETNDGEYVDSFDGRQDPFFSDLIDFLNLECQNRINDDYNLFRLQMQYMILWSAIDRYCTLKYDSKNFQAGNISKLSKDPLFIESINECHLPDHKSIYSSIDAKPWEWRNSPFSKLNFYYKVRGNVVHRGKDWHTNKDILGQCLDELLEIFSKLIDKTFEE